MMSAGVHPSAVAPSASLRRCLGPRWHPRVASRACAPAVRGRGSAPPVSATPARDVASVQSRRGSRGSRGDRPGERMTACAHAPLGHWGQQTAAPCPLRLPASLPVGGSRRRAPVRAARSAAQRRGRVREGKHAAREHVATGARQVRTCSLARSEAAEASRSAVRRALSASRA